MGDVVAGRYEVERILGAGGMGVVVAARHKQLGELVAIKLLPPEAALEGEAVARLLREARATVSIKSEHVVRVLDVGTLDSGSPYILMEYLQGSDLNELVRTKGWLPVPEAVDYVLQACEAVAEAHARGIVHRDLKPSNLFLTRGADDRPLVKVLDFGISKALVPEEINQGSTAVQISLTATKAVFGSPLFMSPEQVRSAKRVDERTDIWSLGIILHELLTGSHPFSGETMPGVLASIAADPPEPLRKRRPDAPAELEEVIARCLVKDVAGRIQSVVELARAIAPFAPDGGKASLERIVRVSKPGGVSKRLGSTPPAAPSTPPLEFGLGSTVKALDTTTGPSARRVRGRRWATALAIALVVSAGVGWRYVRSSRVPPSVAAGPAPSQTAALAVAPAVTHPAATAEENADADAAVAPEVAAPPTHAGARPPRRARPPGSSPSAAPSTAETPDERVLDGR